MGGLTNDSLIAPLDLARFIPAYALLVLVPGYAMAALLRPRSPRTERAALAIPCGYTLVAVSGLTTALLHLPYGLLTYLALALPVTLAALAAWRRARTRTTVLPRGGRETGGTGRGSLGGSVDRQAPGGDAGWWWLAPAGVAAVQAGAFGLAFAPDTVPTGFDVLQHVIWVDQIRRAHVFPIALLSAHLGSSDGAFYPPVFHVLTGLVLAIAPMATYRAVFFVEMASVAALPLALFVYTRAATGSARLGALAAVAAAAFEPLPFFAVAQGLYTFTASYLFVPLLAVALRDGLGRGDRRAVALAALLGIGLFYTHPTEFVTVALLALGIVPGLLRDVRSWLRAVGYGSAAAAVWLIAAAPALAAVHRTMVQGAQPEIHATKVFVRASHVQLSSLVDVYLQWIFGRDLGYLLLLAAVAGIAWCLIRRRLLGLVASQLILTVLFLDSVSYNVFQRFYDLSFPWALWERLAPTHYCFTLPLAAIGIDASARALRGALRSRDRALVALASLPVVILGVALPLGVAAARAGSYSRARHVVAPADLGSIAWLAHHAPPGTVVVNDGDPSHLDNFDAPLDAGRWMPVLGGPTPLYWRMAEGPGSLDARLYLLLHIAAAPLPARAARFVERYHVRYVFYGAAVRPGAARHLDLARLLADPELRLVYSSVAACPAGLAWHRPRCPTNGSYVFSLGGAAGLADAGRGVRARITS